MLREHSDHLTTARDILLELNTLTENGSVKETTVHKRLLVAKTNYLYSFTGCKAQSNFESDRFSSGGAFWGFVCLLFCFLFLYNIFFIFFCLASESSCWEKVGYGTEGKERKTMGVKIQIILLNLTFLFHRLG